MRQDACFLSTDFGDKKDYMRQRRLFFVYGLWGLKGLYAPEAPCKCLLHNSVDISQGNKGQYDLRKKAGEKPAFYVSHHCHLILSMSRINLSSFLMLLLARKNITAARNGKPVPKTMLPMFTSGSEILR